MLYFLIILSYFLGSILFAIIFSKFMKIDDPRTYGSHNAGATNIMRSGNKKAAVFTFLGDFLKGVLAVGIAQLVLGGVDNAKTVIALCGIAVVVGHIFPIYFKFKGGKGFATSLGVMLAFNPWLGLLVILTWLLIFKLSKISSLSAIVSMIFAPLYAFLLMGNNAYFGATIIIALFVLYKHKANMKRLIKKQEQKM